MFRAGHSQGRSWAGGQRGDRVQCLRVNRDEGIEENEVKAVSKKKRKSEHVYRLNHDLALGWLVTVGGKRQLGEERIACGSLGGKYKQVSSCKLKVSGKDWLLPNIQSRKQQAFAAAEGEDTLLSISQDRPNIL